MDAGAGDVFRTVEYRGSRWLMDKLPWAFVAILVGLAFVVYADPRPPTPRVLIFLAYLLAMGVLFALVSALMDRLFDNLPAALMWGLIIAAVIVLFLLVGTPRRSFRGDMPASNMGWMAVCFGFGWIGVALLRHAFPGRPFLTLTPAGLTMQYPFLRRVLIPWREVQDVAPLDRTPPSGPMTRFDDITAIAVSNAFFEQQILPRRRLAPGRGWDFTFAPKGPLMQMALPHPIWLKIAPKDIREPVEARWKAFKDSPATSVPRSSAKPEPPRGPVVVYGRWSPKLTRWQMVWFALPMLGILAVLTNHAGLWDTPGLRAAREKAAARIRCLEDRRLQSQRDKDAGGSGVIIVSGRC